VIVVDTSAILAALISADASQELVTRLSEAPSLHCPHLVDSEVLHALRRLVLHGQLSADRASDALSEYVDLPLIRYPATGLIPRMWELRGSLTGYDATFVALAEALDCPLVTCDAKLNGGQHRAPVEVFAT
jgi:predicted nucleic acid-binding protein